MARDARRKELHRLSNIRWRQRHPDRHRAINKRWRDKNKDYFKAKFAAHPEWQRNHDLKRYGITWIQKEAMYSEQKGLCKLCREPLKGVWVRDTHVEHKPNSQTVRGLVHCKCNQLIRAVETLPLLVARAQEYLKENA